MHMVSTHKYAESMLIDFLLAKIANGDELRMTFLHQAWMTVALGWRTTVILSK